MVCLCWYGWRINVSSCLTGPIGLVIGNEGQGVGRLIKENVTLFQVPMYGDIDSLNASVAAGVLAYEIVTKD